LKVDFFSLKEGPNNETQLNQLIPRDLERGFFIFTPNFRGENFSVNTLGNKLYFLYWQKIKTKK